MSDIRAAAQGDTSETVRIVEYRDRLRSACSSGSDRPELPENLSYNVQRELAIERMRGLTPNQLQQRVDWFNRDSSAAYEVLASDHWELVGDQVRADLADNFDRIRRDSIERMAVKISQQVGASDMPAAKSAALSNIETMLEEKTNVFIKEQFAAAALAGIQRNGSSEDAELVRPFLKSVTGRDVAVRTLARVGTEADVPTLLRIAKESYGNTKIAAGGAAMRFSNNSEEVIQALRQSNDADLVQLTLEEIEGADPERLRLTAAQLLGDENDSTREVAARFLARHANAEEILNVLNSYVAQPRYFYNVAVVLDRAIYRRVGIA